MGSMSAKLPSRASPSISKRSDVVVDQGLQPGPDVGPAQHRVTGDLLQEDPQAEVVVGDRPVGGESGDVGRHQEELVGRPPGQGQVVLAQGLAAQVADHVARLHAQQHRSDDPPEVAQQLGGGVGAGALGLARGRHRGGQPLQVGPPRLEGLQRPVGAGGGGGAEQPAGDGGGQAGGVAHVEVGHPQQLLQADALDGVDVGLGRPLGGRPQRDLAGDVPVDRSLPGEEAGQVTEHRQALERVVPARTGVAHGTDLRPGSDVR